jgi:hypothetical protein
MKKKLTPAFSVLLMAFALSCSKSELSETFDKEKLIQTISTSEKFISFYRLSKSESDLILSTGEEDLVKLQESNKSLYERLNNISLNKQALIKELSSEVGKNNLRLLTRDDLKSIVVNIAALENSSNNLSVNSSDYQTLSPAECRKQFNQETNQCFENFVIDEGACFFQGLWGVVSGCHVESVRDQLKCNRAAQSHFASCH